MFRSPGTPLLLLIITACIFEFSSLDMMLQEQFYDFSLHRWLIDRNDRLLKFIFYDGIKILYLIFALTIATLLLFFRRSTWIKLRKKELTIVLLSLVLVPLGVGALKATTNTPCPRDLARFGGDSPYVTAFEVFPDNLEPDRRFACFPAGHASGGFALIALACLFRRRRDRVVAAGAGITIGWGIGTYKMLIGDHFLSHTLVSMELGWLIIVLIYRLVVYANSEYPQQHTIGA